MQWRIRREFGIELGAKVRCKFEIWHGIRREFSTEIERYVDADGAGLTGRGSLALQTEHLVVAHCRHSDAAKATHGHMQQLIPVKTIAKDGDLRAAAHRTVREGDARDRRSGIVRVAPLALRSVASHSDRDRCLADESALFDVERTEPVIVNRKRRAGADHDMPR